MENLRAIGLVVAAMALFALEDTGVKLAAAELPVGQILAMLGSGGAVIFAVLARSRGAQVFGRDALHPMVLARTGGEIIAASAFVTALTMIPLALATAILQATPLVLTAGAALLLNEKVGWRRWAAISLGFAGVLVILRPGLDGFRPEALWAVLAVLGLSLREIVTRRVPSRIGAPQLSAWAYLGLVPTGLIMLAADGGAVWPDTGTWVALAAALVFGCAGYAALTVAMRMGELSVIIPFRYARLIFAGVIGIAYFGEMPDRTTLIGAVVVVCTGLFTFMRERRLARGTA